VSDENFIVYYRALERVVRAYEHLDQFAGRAKFSTWLTRIAVHDALARQRRGNRYQELEPMSEGDGGDPMDGFASMALNPEEQASNSQIRSLLEAVEKLLDAYRTVFMLRDEASCDRPGILSCSNTRRTEVGPPCRSGIHENSVIQ
jgi:hypothetical protein